MSKKGGKNKGQTISLDQFHGGESRTAAAQEREEESLDFLADEWTGETALERDARNHEERTTGKRTGMHVKAGSMGNFRDDDTAKNNTKIVDLSMPPPYLAYVANLLTGLPETELVQAFGDLSILSVKMITRERSTFAFVEFETPKMLQEAILLDGKHVKSRQMRVDVATEDQKVKMQQDKTRSTGPGGFGTGSNPKTPVISRDGMGFGQASFSSNDRRAPRSNTSQNAPKDFGDFSRDMMGSGQPSAGPNFREGSGAVQPQPPQPSLGPRKGKGNSKVSTPNSAQPKPAARGGGFASWRDEPQEAQPEADQVSEEPKPTKILKRDVKSVEEKETAVPAATPSAPTGATNAAPKASAWANKLAALREN